MRNKNKAILDTSVLLSLYVTELLPYLNLIYKEVLIPEAVEKEFISKDANKRFDFLLKFYRDQSTWFKKCPNIDVSLVSLLQTGRNIGAGEIEAIAQNLTLEAEYEVLLDDSKARKISREYNLIHHGTLYLIGVFDIGLKICDYRSVIERLKQELNFRASEKIIKKVYDEIANELLDI